MRYCVAGMGSIVWSVIGILVAASVGALLYLGLMPSMGAGTTVAIEGYHLTIDVVEVNIKVVGLSPVQVNWHDYYASNGDWVGNRDTCPHATWLNGRWIGGPAPYPITLKPGDVLTIRQGCLQRASAIVIFTDKGNQRGVVT